MTASIADIAYAIMLISHLRADVQHEGLIVYTHEEPVDKSAAIETINAITDEQLHLGRCLFQFKYEQLPSAQRLKVRKRFYEHLKKADTPFHALQKAIEQVTGKPLKSLFEN